MKTQPRMNRLLKYFARHIHFLEFYWYFCMRPICKTSKKENFLRHDTNNLVNILEIWARKLFPQIASLWIFETKFALKIDARQ